MFYLFYTLLKHKIDYIYMIFDTTIAITTYTKYDACNTNKIGKSDIEAYYIVNISHFIHIFLFDLMIVSKNPRVIASIVSTSKKILQFLFFP